MLNISYNNLDFSIVNNVVQFFLEKLEEIPKIRSIYNAIKILFNLPNDRVKIYVAEGARIYRFEMITTSVHKTVLGWIIYIPQQKRLDIYEADSPTIPLIQWKNRKVVFQNYSKLLEMINLPKLFEKIVNVS